MEWKVRRLTEPMAGTFGIAVSAVECSALLVWLDKSATSLDVLHAAPELTPLLRAQVLYL
jgi:hypothetical protein